MSKSVDGWLEKWMGRWMVNIGVSRYRCVNRGCLHPQEMLGKLLVSDRPDKLLNEGLILCTRK